MHPPVRSSIVSNAGNPRLPRTALDHQLYANSYIHSVNIVYPLFDVNSVQESIRRLSSIISAADIELEPSSSAAISLLQITTAAGRQLQPNSAFRADCLRAAYSMLGAVVLECSLKSTQALFLLSLTFRGYNSNELAWHLIALAVTVAQTLGIHRAFSRSHRIRLGENVAEEHVRTWWSIYSLEKLLALELEHPSIIRDQECNQSEPVLNQEPGIFQSLIKLAQVQSQINDSCNQQRSAEEDAEMDYDQLIRDKLLSAGTMDQMILTWEEGLPAELQ
jgi:hypothetical protein